MKALSPYLIFPGTADEAFALYCSVFGGEVAFKQRYGDSPGAENVPEGERDRLIHISMPLPHGGMLMASDCHAGDSEVQVGNNVHLYLDAESEAEVDRFLAGLSAGGSVDMPAERTFWGAYFGMCSDRFGIKWMVGYSYPEQGS